MKVTKVAALAPVAVALFAHAANAAQTQVDISADVNVDIQTYTQGSNYPQAPATVSIGGVDFAISPFPGNAASGGTGVVQIYDPGDTYTFNVSLPGITAVYTLINSAFGSYGSTIGAVVFEDLGGDIATFDLTEGTNIRDHYDGFYNNIATNLYGTQNYPNGVRLDAQQFILPAVFAGSTLTSITFQGSLDTGFPGGGQPFLAAVTATTEAPVPEPSTWAMMIAGFAGLGWLGYARRRAGQTAVA
jgi:hypothetical protein